MNEVIKTLKERRSIRIFKPDMPSRDDIQTIIDAGLYAANAMGEQKVITVAITNKDLRDRLAASNHDIGGFPEGMDPFYGSPCVAAYAGFLIRIKSGGSDNEVFNCRRLYRNAFRRKPGRGGPASRWSRLPY